jgi:hypothetical protein
MAERYSGSAKPSRPATRTIASPTTASGRLRKDSVGHALKSAASRQWGLGKKLLDQYPGRNFKPHPEWGGIPLASRPLTIRGRALIWFPEGKPQTPAENAPGSETFTFVDRSPLPRGPRPSKSGRCAYRGGSIHTRAIMGNALGFIGTTGTLARHVPTDLGPLPQARRELCSRLNENQPVNGPNPGRA